jgi:hypothetical protein
VAGTGGSLPFCNFDSNELRQIGGGPVPSRRVVFVQPGLLTEFDASGPRLWFVHPDLTGGVWPVHRKRAW